MAIKTPRINIVLEKPVFESVQRLAKRDGLSLSSKVRDLIKESLELHEDELLSEFAEQREASFDKPLALSHDETWAL